MTRVTAGLRLDYKRERKPRMHANVNLTQRRKGAKVKTTTADEPAVAQGYGGQATDLRGLESSFEKCAA